MAEDWQLPDDWRDCAKQQRPDLVAKIGRLPRTSRTTTAVKTPCLRAGSPVATLDTPRTCPRRQPEGPQAVRTNERRYPTPEQEKAPPSQAMQAAIENSNRRFREQCQRMGIDPATGMRLTE